MISRIAGLLILTLLLGLGCKNNKNEVPPTVDSTQILPPGKVEQIIVSSGSLFVDTGVTVTIKGQGFDPNMRNGYFLFLKHEGINSIPIDSTLSREFKNTQILKDTNLISIDKATIVFRLPKYSIQDVSKDSAFIYFAKHKASAIFYSGSNNIKNVKAKISAVKKMASTPIYKLLKDTLIISEKYKSANKELIQGTYTVDGIKVKIQVLEYSNTSGYWISTQTYNVPFHKMFTLSMVATKDLFYLPDGSYSFEIYERNGNQRKFVEETGKTKICIKNIP